MRASLGKPIASAPLRNLLGPEDRVLIISDDITRTTPVWRIMPFLMEELSAAGVPDEQVCVVMALGTHRAMSNEEIVRKIGREAFDRFRIENHDWSKDENLIDLGKTASGMEVWVNRLVSEYPFLIGIGQIFPPYEQRFLGGRAHRHPGHGRRENAR